MTSANGEQRDHARWMMTVALALAGYALIGGAPVAHGADEAGFLDLQTGLVLHQRCQDLRFDQRQLDLANAAIRDATQGGPGAGRALSLIEQSKRDARRLGCGSDRSQALRARFLSEIGPALAPGAE